MLIWDRHSALRSSISRGDGPASVAMSQRLARSFWNVSTSLSMASALFVGEHEILPQPHQVALSLEDQYLL